MQKAKIIEDRALIKIDYLHKRLNSSTAILECESPARRMGSGISRMHISNDFDQIKDVKQLRET